MARAQGNVQLACEMKQISLHQVSELRVMLKQSRDDQVQSTLNT